MDMTNGKPSLLIVRFMIPVMIGNIFQQLCTTVDAIIIGRFVGTEALAAIGSVGQIVTFVRNITQGMTIGFAMVTARYFGAGDIANVKKSVGNAVVLSAMITV